MLNIKLNIEVHVFVNEAGAWAFLRGLLPYMVVWILCEIYSKILVSKQMVLIL